MTFDRSLSAFTSSTISEQLKEAYEAKLAEAKKFLGQRHVFAKPVKRLKKKRSY